MEHVNNDMDDLFRKAGEQYPLKSTESDWEGVLGKLKSETLADQQSVSIINANGKTKRRRWALLLLLIPISVGSVILYNSEIKKHPGTSIKTSEMPALVNKRTERQLQKESNQKTNPISQPVTPNPLSRNPSDLVKGPSSPGQSRAVQSQKNGRSSKRESSSHQVIAQRIPGAKKNGVNPATGSLTTSNGSQDVLASAQETKTGLLPASGAVASTISSSASSQKTAAGVETNPAIKASATDSVAGVTAAKRETVKQKSVKGFYVGLLFGPDWTSVKFQSVHQTGYSFGVLAGYRFSKHVAVESGFLLDRKFYYSTGEYFNTSKTGIPVYEPVNSVTGNCFMYEIPINFRYDFSLGKNHSFFANAGLSSYFMKKETYSINFQGRPNAWNYPDTSYYNSTNNLFSILQLSAGYERAIGPRTNIRVEPYIKIPLQGIGIGSMPIASAGIYFGITYSLK
jgi:hypothetical protein